MPFRDCSESCIFLSRTNVYHSITNRETFVPVSRPTFYLPARVDRPGIIRYFLRPRYILARPRTCRRSRCLHGREFNFNFDFLDDCVRRAFTLPSRPSIASIATDRHILFAYSRSVHSIKNFSRLNPSVDIRKSKAQPSIPLRQAIVDALPTDRSGVAEVPARKDAGRTIMPLSESSRNKNADMGGRSSDRVHRRRA